jgi:Zn-dependent membrane protease YugP
MITSASSINAVRSQYENVCFSKTAIFYGILFDLWRLPALAKIRELSWLSAIATDFRFKDKKMNHIAFILGYISIGSAWLLMIGIAIVSFIVQWRFKSKFRQYAQEPLSSGLSGQDVAERMLHDNGIYDVQVVSVEGQLTDHYKPATKTVNLSPGVFYSRSVASAAVAAHECGHAVQHAKAYAWLSLRTAIVPVITVASTITQWTLFIGVMLLFFTNNPFVLAIGVAALALVTAFSFITLPVEFDASNRAITWLRNSYSVMLTRSEYSEAKDALWWAAMTYVVAALGALATLLYYASFLFNRRN